MIFLFTVPPGLTISNMSRQYFSFFGSINFGLSAPNVCFGATSVGYLGHIISEQGVAMDPSKVAAVEAWPRPRTVRALRGFLGLTGYYRKFIASYGVVAGPLTTLLKREAFSWSDEAERTFLDLKRELVTAPLLQLPNFSRQFVIDCDASGSGFGAVLHQGDGAIAFFQ